MDIDRLLQIMVEKGASDLFITTGVPPSIKINGKVVPVTTNKLSPEKCRETVLSVMTDSQRKDFVRDKELNFAISARGVGRFRVSAFYQRNLVAMVCRRIEINIPNLENLGLPPTVKVTVTKIAVAILSPLKTLSSLSTRTKGAL